jgi:hypothetical protein
MQWFVLKISILVLLLSGSYSQAQSCYNFHSYKTCAGKLRSGFKLYGQSESALLEIDSTAVLPVIFYGNKDYVVTVCTERGYYPVHFIIKEVETSNVLYDNMQDNYYESIGFTIDHPQKVTIEVTILADGFEPSDFNQDQACVGVHIQWKRRKKTGFSE